MQTIQKFDVNQHGWDFVLGDLHGCYDLLMTEMGKVNFDRERDRIFSVGDLIDRGPDSLKCLELVFEPWFFSVLGNHCEMMFCGLLDRSVGEYQCWVQNGGLWHVTHLDDQYTTEAFEATLEAARSLMPLAFEIRTSKGETVGVLHADAPVFWNEALIRDCRMNTLWGRNRIGSRNASLVRDIDRVYVGHTPTKGIDILGNVVYIDTGSVWSNNLTLLEI